MLAGGWAAFLIFYRLIDKPGETAGVVVGVRWGIFLALLAAGLLAYTGYRIRAAHRPEPPLPGEAGEDRRATRVTEPLVQHERRDPPPARRPPRPPAPPRPPNEAPTATLPGRRPPPRAPAPDDPPEAPF